MQKNNRNYQNFPSNGRRDRSERIQLSEYPWTIPKCPLKMPVNEMCVSIVRTLSTFSHFFKVSLCWIFYSNNNENFEIFRGKKGNSAVRDGSSETAPGNFWDWWFYIRVLSQSNAFWILFYRKSYQISPRLTRIGSVRYVSSNFARHSKNIPRTCNISSKSLLFPVNISTNHVVSRRGRSVGTGYNRP